jgi:glutamate dehydrogenase (NAD(P)+)
MNKKFHEIDIEFSLQSGAQAFLAIHTIVNGTSSGGMRICEDLSIDEVRALSREMTLKFSIFELGRGGAKSGIRIPPGVGPEGRRNILRELGERMAPIIHSGLYYPGMDMNCTQDDLRIIYGSAGLPLGNITDSSYFTALSVANAVEVIRLKKRSTAPLRIAIEGFGSVASYLASRLPTEHYRIVALSTVKGAVSSKNGFPQADLASARKEYGDDCIFHLPSDRKLDRESLFEAETDILIPAARTWSITRENANKVNAKWIVSAANAPCTSEAISRLQECGIEFLPGFVCNAGGVFGSTLFDVGVPEESIEEVGKTLYRDVIASLLDRAGALGKPASAIAEKVAIARYEKMAGDSSRSARTALLLKKARQRGLLPKALYGRIRLRQFRDSLRSLSREISEA